MSDGDSDPIMYRATFGGGSDPDILMRQAAFERIRNLSEEHDPLPFKYLNQGFCHEGKRIRLVNLWRGIFKPPEMKFLLSIRTVVARHDRAPRYDDQLKAHHQIFQGSETIDYDFMGDNPEAAENRWLREASENGIPVIYFLGVKPALYLPVFPVFIAGWDAKALKARVAFGLPGHEMLAAPADIPTRSYGLRLTKHRLHQANFRTALIRAYRGRCALSGLPEQRLLDAAHIVPDRDELLGQPVIPNGILLSKIHHAAFDAHLISIDPDYRLHVSDRLLDQNDGPMLEALKSLKNEKIKHLPEREQDRPGRDRLERHYECFKAIT